MAKKNDNVLTGDEIRILRHARMDTLREIRDEYNPNRWAKMFRKFQSLALVVPNGRMHWGLNWRGRKVLDMTKDDNISLPNYEFDMKVIDGEIVEECE